MKTPKEQVIEYVEKRYQKEKEKWSDGLRNQYLEWEDYYVDETNDVMYRKLKALEDIEEDLGIDLFRYLSGLKRVLEND